MLHMALFMLIYLITKSGISIGRFRGPVRKEVCAHTQFVCQYIYYRSQPYIYSARNNGRYQAISLVKRASVSLCNMGLLTYVPPWVFGVVLAGIPVVTYSWMIYTRPDVYAQVRLMCMDASETLFHAISATYADSRGDPEARTGREG